MGGISDGEERSETLCGAMAEKRNDKRNMAALGNGEDPQLKAARCDGIAKKNATWHGKGVAGIAMSSTAKEKKGNAMRRYETAQYGFGA